MKNLPAGRAALGHVHPKAGAHAHLDAEFADENVVMGAEDARGRIRLAASRCAVAHCLLGDCFISLIDFTLSTNNPDTGRALWGIHPIRDHGWNPDRLRAQPGRGVKLGMDCSITRKKSVKGAGNLTNSLLHSASPVGSRSSLRCSTCSLRPGCRFLWLTACVTQVQWPIAKRSLGRQRPRGRLDPESGV